jgi:stage III sporulation protein AF
MQWLGGWLKEIIIIILIASFADLLLPNKTMQRYVRTVIGLFLLMLLLSPVLRLFQMNWDTDGLLAAVENSSGKAIYANGSGGTGKAVNTATLAAILQEGQRLSAADQVAATKLVEDRLADAVKTGVEGRFAERVLQVAVTTALDKNQTLSVKQVALVLAPPQSGGIATEATETAIAVMEPIRRMDPVKPVTITVSDQEKAGKTEEASAAAAQQKTNAAFAAANEADIVAYIRDGWQIEPGSISVKRMSEE